MQLSGVNLEKVLEPFSRAKDKMAGMAGMQKEMEKELDVLNNSLKPYSKQVISLYYHY